MRMKKVIQMTAMALLVSGLTISSAVTANAKECKSKKTTIKKAIEAKGVYQNWDGVTNVSQFKDAEGEFCFAYDNGKYVNVVKTKNGVPVKGMVKLKKKTSTFGAVTCDMDGYYYVVTGKKNTTKDTSKKTIFISKYDKTGKMIKSIGDNGSSKNAYYDDPGFYTKNPFYGGNCDVAVNGEYLAVNYAREMYSGHQSNSLFLVNRKSMKKVSAPGYYNSHSFAQRVVPYGDNFILASQGDCYPRSFSIATVDVKTGDCNSQDAFNFWVKKGTLNRWDMSALNTTFAHMGGLAVVNTTNVAFVGTSAKSLNSKAIKENQQLFIQILDPNKNLREASGYVTTGTRSGYSGPNGNEKVKNYGVKWLTNYSSKYKIRNAQVIATDKGNYVILFEREKGYTYQGAYYMVLDSSGKIKTKATKLSSSMHLNPSEMPVYIKGKIYWVGNVESYKDTHIYINSVAVR